MIPRLHSSTVLTGAWPTLRAVADMVGWGGFCLEVLGDCFVDFQGGFAVVPGGFDGAGAGGGEGDVAQAQDPLHQSEGHEGVLHSGQIALEDIDAEDAADLDDALVG